MREVCNCGWTGATEDRTPIDLTGTHDWALACPRCGRHDPVDWLSGAARRALIDEARRRHERRVDTAGKEVAASRATIAGAGAG